MGGDDGTSSLSSSWVSRSPYTALGGPCSDVRVYTTDFSLFFFLFVFLHSKPTKTCPKVGLVSRLVNVETPQKGFMEAAGRNNSMAKAN